MKNLALLIVAVVFGVATVSATNPPVSNAALLPADFKTEVSKHIDYPNNATETGIEGEVWMKVTLDENSEVQIVDLSATNPELGEHVKNQLENVSIKNTSFVAGNVYFMKVKFDLLN